MISELVRTLPRLPTSVVVYDLETSGLSPEYDQIFQIAALRTDQSFCDPIDQASTLELRARRQPWVIPSPVALLVTRIEPTVLSSGLLHHELLVQTETFFRARPSMFLTYNGIKFDERFLRNALYRSLCRPYLTQTSGSTRADLMLMTQAISVLDPGVIKVPMSEKGRSTYRLGAICRANGIEFPEATAHDALADVRATLALARHLKQVAPLWFDHTLALADKSYSASILRPGTSIFRLGVYGGTPVLRVFGVVESVEGDANARVCVDLTINPDEYLNLPIDQLCKWSAQRPSPLAVIRVNAQEMVFAADEPIASDALLPLARSIGKKGEVVSLRELQDRGKHIAGADDFIDRLHTIVAERRATLVASPHADEQLYSGGFASDADYRCVERARSLYGEQRHQCLASIADQRLKEFILRIAYEEGASQGDDGLRARMQEWAHQRILGPADAPWRTIAAARNEIVEALPTASDDQRQRLSAIEAWLAELEVVASATIVG